MRTPTRVAFVFSLVLAASGCELASHPEASSGLDALPSEQATVRFLGLEGGCWVLDTKEGRVEPVDLPKNYQVDGLQVVVKLTDALEMVSACQVGPIKRVMSIRRK